MFKGIIRTAVLVATLALMHSPAQANLFWSQGPAKNSIQDRAVVTFPARYRVGDIVVSFADRRLYYVEATGRATSYPIAVPRPESRWDGVERVTWKKKNPSWTPTARMRRENPALPVHVEGGDPRNPMGIRAIYLGSTLYRIHGTDAPHTIGHNVSQGCIRMHNAHVAELYERVKIGAKVIATWERFTAPAVPGLAQNRQSLASVFDARN